MERTAPLPADAVTDDELPATVDLDRFLASVRRQWRVVAVGGIVGLFVGVLYIVAATPLYTATTTVLIDRENRALADRLSALSGVVDDEATVLSQVELLKSDTIALAVVDRLGLAEDPVFNASEGILASTFEANMRAAIDAVGRFVSGGEALDPADARRQKAARRLREKLSVSRIGRTHVLEVAYVSPSPALASRIARTIADAYLTDKLDSRYEATRRAGAWLQERIEELRRRSLESDLAVQKFRTARGLVSTGERLITDQQLGELSSALIVAQADTAKARANLSRIRDIIARGQTDAIVTDMLQNSVSNRLREKYLEASKREAEIASRLGGDHAQAVRLRGEMREYRRLMFEELGRIAESYRSDLDVAESREKSLADSVARASGVSASVNETQVELRELEREADTYRKLYQTFLQRYQEAIQQQSFPVTEARIISLAATPDRPSHPQKPLVILFSIFFGWCAGFCVGAVREFRDRFFRIADHVRQELGLEFLGMTPLVAGDGQRALEEMESDGRHPRAVRKPQALSNHVIDHPLSGFAETMRSARIAVDLGVGEKPCRIVGVISVLPGEGKTTVAVNFAELLANQGMRTLLVDADLRNPGATRAIGRHADGGLVEAVLEGRSIRDLCLMNQKTSLFFLPAVVRRRIPHSSELLASPGMGRVLEAAERNFRYVVLDLPPLAPLVDARAIAARIDAFILVVEWGKTARHVVRQTLLNDPLIAGKCIGVVLNKVDNEKMKLYRRYGSAEYYLSRYSSYYLDS